MAYGPLPASDPAAASTMLDHLLRRRRCMAEFLAGLCMCIVCERVGRGMWGSIMVLRHADFPPSMTKGLSSRSSEGDSSHMVPTTA